MQTEKISIGDIPSVIYGPVSDKAFLFVYGKNGRKEEAVDFAETACGAGWQVLSADLPGCEKPEKRELGEAVPWNVVPELRLIMGYMKERWKSVGLRANSIGAWFSMLAFQKEKLDKCLFVSPVLDMEKLILSMMKAVSVSEERLKTDKIAETPFGQTLSWKYLSYVRENPVTSWTAPTDILYGGGDKLIVRDTVELFRDRFNAGLTVMEDGEHWFHTPAQLEFLKMWTAEILL